MTSTWDDEQRLRQSLGGLPPRVARALREVVDRDRVGELAREITGLANALAAYNGICQRTRVLEGLLTGNRPGRVSVAGDPEPPHPYMWDAFGMPWARVQTGWVLMRPRRRWGPFGKIARFEMPAPDEGQVWQWVDLVRDRDFMIDRSPDGLVTPPGV